MLMKLLYSQTSPFARKVIVAARELGLELALEPVSVTPVTRNPEVSAANPLVKVPILVLDDGETIYDSRTIVAYLDSLTDRCLAPRAGPARWRVLTELAAADGLLDAALLARYEVFLRPEQFRWMDWYDGQFAKIRGALDLFEAAHRRPGDDQTIADIGVACALGYLDLRVPDEAWRASRPNLAAFFTEITARPSWAGTDPTLPPPG
jgi:glutathione S-transferase